MFQNLKVDIAYYKTGTDFEMEFNLCGCCRMRLLTDKTPDKKSLVYSLARAVNRSRVIIIVGNLFGADGIINIAAGATGSKIAKVDNNAYGIESDAEIKIISGSTPLVTPEGYFGGCIIEKGPQTMILLTENKNVRKTVMKTLIHPYIEELCAIELQEKAAAATPETLNETEPETEVLENQEVEDLEFDFVMQNENEDVAEVNTQVENEGELYNFVAEDEGSNEPYYEEEMDLVTDEDYEEIEMENSSGDDFAPEDETYKEVESDMLYSDEKSISLKEFKRRNEDYYNSEKEAFEGLVSEDEDYPERMTFRSGLGTPILILSIVLLILLVVLCYCIFYVPATQGVASSAYVKEIFDSLFG